MKTIKDYTVIELINKYKEYIGNDLELLAYIGTFDYNNKETLIKTALKSGENVMKAAFHILYSSYVLNNSGINNNTEIKRKILAKIYYKLSDKMKEEDKNELIKLLLDNRKYVSETVEIYDKNGEKINNYIVLTKEPKKTLSDLKNEKTKNLVSISIDSLDEEDLKAIIENKYSHEFYTSLTAKLGIEFLILKKGFSMYKIRKCLEDARKNGESLLDDELLNEFNNIIKSNLQLVNIDDIMMAALARMILGVKLKMGEKYSDAILNSEDGSLELTIEFIKELKEELKRRGNKNRRCTISDKDKNTIIDMDLNKAEEFLARCYNSHYYSDEEIKKAHIGILNGILPESVEVKRIIDINKNDFINACKSYELVEENDEEKKKRILNCAVDIADYLRKQNIISNEEIIRLYMNGMVCLDIVKQIKMDNLTEKFYNEKFKNFYDELIYSTGEKNMSEQQLSRFTDLYKILMESDIVNVEELIENLINAYGIDKRIGVLEDLEELGLVSLDKCIEYDGINYLVNLYQKGKFMPGKIREFYDETIFTLDDIVSFINLIDGNNEKYLAIGAIFPGENESDVLDRDLLVSECLQIDDGVKSKTKGKKKKVGEINLSDEFITDPFARLSVFKELDSSYQLEMTLDGHVIVTCPNSEKVIIEKMFDKNNMPYYGAATYVLDLQYYKANQSDIIKNDYVIRQELTQNAKTIGVTQIKHVKNCWGEEIKKEFNIETGKKYTEEEIKKIDEAIARVERSRTKR